MVDKRFQVFISSTFVDLQEERQEVIHALLELDSIPSGMELFPAANDNQWDLIKRVIDDCDYYMLIIGGRYGSIAPDGLSFTEKEYRYALSQNKPIISFLHKDPGTIAASKTEKTDEGKIKLKAFRELAEQKLCKHWNTPQELGSVVSRSLIQLIKTSPAIGWVRANELADQEATLELLKLRKEVDQLRKELAQARFAAPTGSEHLAQGDERCEWKFYVKGRGDYGTAEKSVWLKTTASWNEIFAQIAPSMMHEITDDAMEKIIDNWIKLRQSEDIQKWAKKYDLTKITATFISTQDFNTIKIQFKALGLIKKSDKQRSVRDTGTYWTLTPYGDEVMTRLLAIQRDKK